MVIPCCCSRKPKILSSQVSFSERGSRGLIGIGSISYLRTFFGVFEGAALLGLETVVDLLGAADLDLLDKEDLEV